MKYYRVSCNNCIIEADNDEQARIGFANYMGDIGMECFKVEELTEEEMGEMEENDQEADWTQ